MENSVQQIQQIPLRERVIIITPAVRQWHGATTMHAQDFQCAAEELPPEKARKSLGAKYLINPDSLLVFRKLRKRLFTTLAEAGIADPVLKGSYFIPLEKADEVIEKIERFCQEYQAEADAFADRYDQLTQEWALENPEFSTQILAAGKTKHQIRARFGCSFSAYKMSPIPGQEQAIEDRVKNLIGPILDEASETARAALDTYIRNKDEDKGGLRLRARIVKIVDKLESMSCVNGNLYTLCEKLRPLVDSLPTKKTGFKGQSFYTAFTCLHVLASKELMQAVAEGKADLDALSESLRIEREEERRLKAPETGRLTAAVIRKAEDMKETVDALW